MAELITVRGNRAPVSPIGEVFTVDELQNLVDGWIGILPTLHGVLVFDDDGQYKDKYMNFEATRLVKEYYESIGEEWNDFIAGNAVLCERGMISV